MREKLSESPTDDLKRSGISHKNRLLVGIIIVLVVLLVVSTSIAIYYASNRKPSQNNSNIQETMVLDNQSVIGAGGFRYEYAGTFVALEPGYLVVTSTSFPVNYSIALEIVMNATRPDGYVTINGIGTEEPMYNIRQNSANSTLITVPVNNDFSLLPVLRGNVSIYVYTSNGYNAGVVLNATYYY